MKANRIVRSMAVMVLVAAGVGASSVVPAAADPPPQYFVDEAKLPFGEIPGLPTNRYWGVHGGAGYRIEVPQNWNGDLVMWAHGFRRVRTSSSPSTIIRCGHSSSPMGTHGRRQATRGTTTTSPWE